MLNLIVIYCCVVTVLATDNIVTIQNDVPDSIYHISSYVLEKKNDIQGITFQNPVGDYLEPIISIGDYAFTSLTSLQEVTFVDTIETIGKYAFSRTSVKEIDLSMNKII